MARVGLDQRTGKLLYGWDHCAQSIRKIIETEIGERVQRRLFGSKLPRLIDKPQNEEHVIEIYMAVATALEPRVVEGRQYGEPGFVLLQELLDASVPGTVTLKVGGVFFEHGHLGDYSNPSVRQLAVTFSNTGEGFFITSTN